MTVLLRSSRAVSLTAEGKILFDAVASGFADIRRAVAQLRVGNRARNPHFVRHHRHFSANGWCRGCRGFRNLLPDAGSAPARLRCAGRTETGHDRHRHPLWQGSVSRRRGRGVQDRRIRAGLQSAIENPPPHGFAAGRSHSHRWPQPTAPDTRLAALVRGGRRHRHRHRARVFVSPTACWRCRRRWPVRASSLSAWFWSTDALSSGLLVQPFDITLPGDTYHFVSAPGLWDRSDIAVLRDWFVKNLR